MAAERPLHVLVVDDDAIDRKSVIRALRTSSDEFDVLEASTCAQAMECLSAHEVDCAIVDFYLPDGDASRILLKIAQERLGVPVVVLTGQGDEELAVQLLQAGAADYLTKSSGMGERIPGAVRRAVRLAEVERKARQAEDDLRAHRESLATTLRSIADAVVTTDSTGNVTYLNPAAERLLEVDDARANGKPLWQLVRVDDGNFETRVRQALLGSPVASSRNRLSLLRSDGSRLEVEERVSLLMGSDRSTPSGAVISLTDVTEQRRAEKRLAFLAAASPVLGATRELSPALDTAVNVAVPTLADACLVGVAPRNGGRVQWARAESVDFEPPLFRELCEAQLFTPDDMDHPLSRASSLGAVAALDLEQARELLIGSGAAEQSKPTAVLVPFSAHSVFGLLLMASRSRRYDREDMAFAQDFGRRVGLAVDNAWLLEQLARAIRIRDDLLAVVSHDLRSPLGTLMLVAESLEDEWGSEDGIVDHAKTVTRSVERMDRLIRDLLDAESIETGSLAVSIESTNIAGVLEDSVALFASQADERGIALIAEIDGRLPLVSADPHRIGQVLANLIGNALKFTERGGSITVGGCAQSATVTLSVTDTGRGIPAEDIPHLFDRFWRGDRKAPGAGLGLAIASGLVLAHGSRLRVQSKPGAGSRFYFELPAVD
ncbi:MAG: response regulator [Myxococcales bacterium]|nr:response regulator [Myxococcales bacterium]MCB9575483.1 response regulator [Polyangiaceae bacterium]